MLQKIKGKLDKGLAAVSVKSESFVETGRTKAAISNLEARREEAVAELGRRYYAGWKAGAVDAQAVEEACAAVDAVQTEIDKLTGRLEQIKREEEQLLGKKAAGFCAQCGKPLTEDAKFCMHCGSPVEK